MLLLSANAPYAVLKPPVAFLRSAPAPVAVFSSAVFTNSAPDDGCVERVRCVASKREKTNCCVETASGEAEESILPFCRIATGVTPVRRWNDCLRFGQKPKADEDDEK